MFTHTFGYSAQDDSGHTWLLRFRHVPVLMRWCLSRFSRHSFLSVDVSSLDPLSVYILRNMKKGVCDESRSERARGQGRDIECHLRSWDNLRCLWKADVKDKRRRSEWGNIAIIATALNGHVDWQSDRLIRRCGHFRSRGCLSSASVS